MQKLLYKTLVQIWIYMMWALFNTIACDCLAKQITTVTGKKEQILYCDAIYYVRLL